MHSSVTFVQILQLVVTTVASSGIVIAYLAWKSKQNMERRAAALAYSLTRNKDYFDARSAIELRFRDFFRTRTQVPADEMAEITSSEKELSTKVRFILAHWEIMAIAIYDDLIDEYTCFEMVGSTLVNTVRVMELHIMKLRENPLNARRYDYLLILNKEWSAAIEQLSKEGPISRYSQYIERVNDGRPPSKSQLRRALQSNLRAKNRFGFLPYT